MPKIVKRITKELKKQYDNLPKSKQKELANYVLHNLNLQRKVDLNKVKQIKNSVRPLEKLWDDTFYDRGYSYDDGIALGLINPKLKKSMRGLEKFLTVNSNLLKESAEGDFNHKYNNAKPDILNMLAPYINHVNWNQPVDNRNFVSFNVPYDERPIKVTKGGINTGTYVYPTVLDTLAARGIKNNLPPNSTFGLPAQESTFLNYSGAQIPSKDMFNNDRPYRFMVNTNSYVKDTPITREGLQAIENPKQLPYLLAQYANYDTTPVDDIDWSHKKFKNGTYNKGDKRHTNMVNNRGTQFVNSPTIQDWFFNHYLPGLENESKKREALRWWRQ